jgi:hypothetical protein
VTYIAEYRALAEAAAACDYPTLVGSERVTVAGRELYLPLVVMLPPFRVALLIAERAPGLWMMRRAEESLSDFTRRAWKRLGPLERAAMHGGYLPLWIPASSAVEHADAFIGRLGYLRAELFLVVQEAFMGVESSA